MKQNCSIRQTCSTIPAGSVPPDVRLTPPTGGRILLHCCCAPCSSAILECMTRNGLRPVVFFSNSNIIPADEYSLRKQECIRYCSDLGLDFIDDVYDHDAWLSEAAAGHEADPERGGRCSRCFLFRLRRAAAYAAANGFACLATTLASSRWKDASQVNDAGQKAVLEVNAATGSNLVWWDQDWRKGGLQPRRSYLVKELGFYNQSWCGCEFSKK